jgi:hypothetical protein
VAILGSTLALEYAPWHDRSWTLIAHPCCRGRCAREPDWYFDLHRRECFTQAKSWNRQYYSWLQRLQTPIFMQEQWPEIPMAIRYPRETVEAEFATRVTGRLFATNHCAYMFPLALMEGVTHIGLFGCQYAATSEHGVQRDSLLYWLGRFEQAGGTLVIPRKHNTLLCSPKELYGYESHDERGKLIAAYRAPVALMPAAATAKGPAARVALHLIDEETTGGRIPLMPPPGGEPIAWERSRHAIHA